jgi:glycine betaine/proline transport system substrate-binding protein
MWRKIVNKFLTGLGVVAISTTLSVSDASAQCGDVSIASMQWDSGVSISAVAEIVLEVGYGCTVISVATDTTSAVTSLAEDEQPDIVPELWVNSAQDYPALEATGRIITASDVFANGFEEAWWIPTYLAEEHPELTTIEGILANPDKIGGRFHNCPVNWGCRIVNDHLKVVHQLEANGIEVFNHDTMANLTASIASAFDDERPWFGYYWGPTAVLEKYKMTRVDIGPVVPEQHAINATENADPDEIGISDFPQSPVINVITADFAKREPEVAEFIRKMTFPNEIVNAMLAWQEDNDASVEETATWVLTNHKDLILSWVSEDAKNKLNDRL